MLNEERYKEYKLKGLLDSKQLYKNEHPTIKFESTIAKTFKKQFNILEDEYDSYVEKFSDIQKIKSKYTEKRAAGFKSIVKFYDWYKKQPQVCGYCYISQKELYELFTKNENKKLPLNNAIKRSYGTLEIERKDSTTNTYDDTNSILTCPLCNNAKSNLIDEDSWFSLFVSPMREYYKKLLNRDLEYDLPIFDRTDNKTLERNI
ncbi:MAG: hypothetical protein JXQ68_02060 [Campylobacterales bacterium]|nr:hypothetical protein [Campylobacterales bacterium]